MAYKTIVAGGRKYDNEAEMDRVLKQVDAKHGISVIVTGAQRQWDKDKKKYVGADY